MFLEHRTQRHSIQWRVKWVAAMAWFLPARKIFNYNMRDVVDMYPDWVGINGVGMGEKVRPFLGYVFLCTGGEKVRFAWWKHLVRYNP